MLASCNVGGSSKSAIARAMLQKYVRSMIVIPSPGIVFEPF